MPNTLRQHTANSELGSRSIHNILPHHASAKQRVDTLLEAFLARPTLPDSNLMRSALFPGRRLRPTLLVHLSDPLDTSHATELDRLALAIEMGHRASIILDDLLDNDVMRRGLPAFHILHGDASTVLVSHRLVSEAFLQLSTLQPEVLTIAQPAFAATYRAMAIGELTDIGAIRDDAVSALSLYEQHVLPKTSALFGFIFEMAALFRARLDRRLLSAVGERIGRLYQVYNDIYDDSLATSNSRGTAARTLPLSLMAAVVLGGSCRRDARFVKSLLGSVCSTNQQESVRELFSSPRYRTAALEYAAQLRDDTLILARAIQDATVAQLIEAFAVWLQQTKCWDHDELHDAGY